MCHLPKQAETKSVRDKRMDKLTDDKEVIPICQPLYSDVTKKRLAIYEPT